MAVEDSLMGGLGRSQFFGSLLVLTFVGVFPQTYSSFAGQLGAADAQGVVSFQNHVLIIAAAGVTIGYLIELINGAVRDRVAYCLFAKRLKLREYDSHIDDALKNSIDFATVYATPDRRERFALLSHQLEGQASASHRGPEAEMRKASFSLLVAPAFFTLALAGAVSGGTSRIAATTGAFGVGILLIAVAWTSYSAFVNRTKILLDTDEKVKRERDFRKALEQDREKAVKELNDERSEKIALQQKVKDAEEIARVQQVRDAVAFMESENPKVKEVGATKFIEALRHAGHSESLNFWTAISDVAPALEGMKGSPQFRDLLEALAGALEHYVSKEHYSKFAAKLGPSIMALHKALPFQAVSDAICRVLGFMEDRAIAEVMMNEVVKLVTAQHIEFGLLTKHGYTQLLTGSHLSDLHRDFISTQIGEVLVRSEDELAATIGLDLAKALEKRNKSTPSRGQIPQWARNLS